MMNRWCIIEVAKKKKKKMKRKEEELQVAKKKMNRCCIIEVAKKKKKMKRKEEELQVAKKKKKMNRKEEELEVVAQLLAQHPNDYLIWRQRRCMVENIGLEAVSDELKFTNKILLSKPPGSTYNIQAWSHREWIIQKFDTNLWLPELRYCHEILDRDIFNASAWEQICRAVRLYPNMTKESRDVEVAYAKRVIYEQPGNEGPWAYLTFLCLKDLPSLYKNLDLERVYVDFLSEEADRIKFGCELDPRPGYMTSNYAYVDKRGCLNALNLVSTLMVVGYEASLNTRLVEAVDVLLENLDGTYSHKSLDYIKKGSEFSRKVTALVLSLDVSRIRYHKRCRGYSCNPVAFGIIYEEGHHENSMGRELEAMDICDDNLPSLEPFEEGFERWLTTNGFGGFPMEWKERLTRSYLKKRTQYNRDENDALEDLKWNARRVMVKIAGSNKVALDELQFTTDTINDNAYNHRAWSHRQWVFHAFGKDWEDKAELEFCGAIIENNPYNTFAWDQRYFVITRIVSRIYKEKDWHPVYYNRKLVEKYSECLDERRCEERDFALKFMDANPENHLPWAHISGLYNTYASLPEPFCENTSLLNAILHVLEEARDCRRLDDLDKTGCVMSLSVGSSALVSNAKAVINALSMLSEFTIDRRVPLLEEEEEEEEEYIRLPRAVSVDGNRFKVVLDQLCKDSWFETFFLKPKIQYSFKMCAIVGAMEKALTDSGCFVIHPIDELFTRHYSGFVSTTF